MGLRHKRLGPFQVHADQLADALFLHRDAEQPVHPRHGDRVVGDDKEPRIGAPGHLVQKIAEARDVGIVKRRVHLVQNADRRGVGQEDREDQRQRRQGLFPPPTEATAWPASCPAAGT